MNVTKYKSKVELIRSLNNKINWKYWLVAVAIVVVATVNYTPI